MTNQLTLFTLPKPFHGHIDTIQTNAIKSWLLLQPRPEVILFGDEEGTARLASELAIRHIPKIACNEYGTPLVSSLFHSAQDIACHQFMCYVNADIILMSDFLPAIRQIKKSSFLAIGQRWDIDIREELDFNNPGWENQLRAQLAERGKLHGHTGLDYFVFPRGLYQDIPPFAIGRTAWDNWLVYQARSLDAPVIDATQSIVAVHQNHDYSHSQGGAISVWKGPEAVRNRELAGWGEHGFTLEHATWILSPQGMKRALSLRYLYFRLDAVPVLSPRLHFLRRPMKALTRVLIRSRSMLGINQN